MWAPPQAFKFKAKVDPPFTHDLRHYIHLTLGDKRRTVSISEKHKGIIEGADGDIHGAILYRLDRFRMLWVLPADQEVPKVGEDYYFKIWCGLLSRQAKF